jgi:hypothetical protein
MQPTYRALRRDQQARISRSFPPTSARRTTCPVASQPDEAGAERGWDGETCVTGSMSRGTTAGKTQVPKDLAQLRSMTSRHRLSRRMVTTLPQLTVDRSRPVRVDHESDGECRWSVAVVPFHRLGRTAEQEASDR